MVSRRFPPVSRPLGSGPQVHQPIVHFEVFPVLGAAARVQHSGEGVVLWCSTTCSGKWGMATARTPAERQTISKAHGLGRYHPPCPPSPFEASPPPRTTRVSNFDKPQRMIRDVHLEAQKRLHTCSSEGSLRPGVAWLSGSVGAVSTGGQGRQGGGDGGGAGTGTSAFGHPPLWVRIALHRPASPGIGFAVPNGLLSLLYSFLANFGHACPFLAAFVATFGHFRPKAAKAARGSQKGPKVAKKCLKIAKKK